MTRTGAVEMVLDSMKMVEERGLEKTISILEDLHRNLSDALMEAARDGEPTAEPFVVDSKETFEDLDEAITVLKGMR